MKIVFLDIDGVLTVPATKFKAFHPDCLKALRRILETTDAKMVLSSCWRHGFIDWPNEALIHHTNAIPTMKRWFVDAGWPQDLADRLIDKTPDFVCTDINSPFASDHRGTEISMWLAKNKIDSFVILDDDCDMEPHLSRHVLTDGEKGLSESNADRAISLLTEKTS
jgi:hypothetical protein